MIIPKFNNNHTQSKMLMKIPRYQICEIVKNNLILRMLCMLMNFQRLKPQSPECKPSYSLQKRVLVKITTSELKRHSSSSTHGRNHKIEVKT